MDAWPPPEEETVRVVVVSADPLARAGLVSLLSEQPGSRVVAELSSPEDLPLVGGADVVLWDTAGEGAEESGLAETALPVLALVADGDPSHRLLALGVRGVLTRHAGGRQLAAALAALAEGLVVLEPGLVPASAGEPSLAPREELTPREHEVLQLLAEGLPNKRIARELEISEHTVKFHVNGILAKLGAGTRTEAVMRAARLGLIVV